MARMVKCVKLGVEAGGMESPPFPGLKGQFIYDNISQKVWQEWVEMQTMIINEQRLASFDPKARKLLEEEREKFLFAGGFEMPEGYVPKKG